MFFRIAATLPRLSIYSFKNPSKIAAFAAKILTPRLAPLAIGIALRNPVVSCNDRTIQVNKNARFIPKKSDKDLFDLGGYTGILDRVADLVRYLQNPQEFTKSGVKPPKGVILSGPPGVGKTYIAEAVAGHAGVPIIMISGPEIETGYIGHSEALLRELFRVADAIAPCVICIDEFDSIARKRIVADDSGSSVTQVNAHWINSVVNQLLTLLSQDHPGVIVIATTNHIDALDPAVVREGRFDRHIALTLPNRDERKNILEVHAKERKMAPSVSLEDLAAISSGFSGAKLAAWINEAALAAAREQTEQIENRHFDAARTLLDQGVRRPGCQDPLTAAHEAGRALVGHLLGQKVYKVSTYQFGETRGSTEWIPEEGRSLTQSEALNQICTLLAGRAAEALLNTPRINNDNHFYLAKRLASRLVEEGLGNRVEEILQKEMERAKGLLQKNRKTWETLRDSLIDHGELLREDFLKVIEGKPVVKTATLFSATLPLPPKAVSRFDIVEMACQPKTTLPITLEEVVDALHLEPSSIRSFGKRDLLGGYVIKFKPSYENRKLLEGVSNTLKKHDIENYYNTYSNELTIYPDGEKEFIEFLKNGSKK